jgi:hypothetical protein
MTHIDTTPTRPQKRDWRWPLFTKRCAGCGVEIRTPAPNRGTGKKELLCAACEKRQKAATR